MNTAKAVSVMSAKADIYRRDTHWIPRLRGE